MLYIVSTPIGNLGDITVRGLEVLKSVDLIASEDTRHTGTLLRHFGITTPQTSYFEHNQRQKTSSLIETLKSGKSVALVSDAGTPGISDPGFLLVREARAAGIPVTVVPGACAAIAALSLSGLPTDRFIFEGFLPPKSAARRRRLEAFRDETRTVIFYESPYRLAKTLADIAAALDNPEVTVTREITKKFEETRSGRAADLAAYYTEHTPRGEFVILK